MGHEYGSEYNYETIEQKPHIIIDAERTLRESISSPSLP
jgi:hypothetical protein